MNKEYRVVWEIDIYASSPLEAAQLAREMQNPHTYYSYDVIDAATDIITVIDLLEEETIL